MRSFQQNLSTPDCMDIDTVNPSRFGLSQHRGYVAVNRLMDISPGNYSHHNIPLIEDAIAHLKGIKESLYEDEYNAMKNDMKAIVTKKLRNATMATCEPCTSSLHPRECLKEIETLSRVDQQFMEALINSAEIKDCQFPTYQKFVSREGPTGDEGGEFQFMIVFSFGFQLEQIREAISHTVKSRDVPECVCGVIADLVGDSFFKIKLSVYFDTTKPEWNEQDGEAWIFHRSERGEQEDVVNFDQDDRIYFVEDWPIKGLVVGSDEKDTSVIENSERRLVAWTCCQIIWFALSQYLDPKICHSVEVRNMTKKLMFVLKGWFTGLLLGESFEPQQVQFDE